MAVSHLDFLAGPLAVLQGVIVLLRRIGIDWMCFYSESGETLGQVTQGSGGCPVAGNI